LRNAIVFCGVQSWVTGRRLVSLPFSDHCEPLVDSAEELQSILSHLRTYRHSNNWKYIDVRPLSNDLGCAFQQEGFQALNNYYVHTIDLRSDEDQLLRRFHKTSIQQRIHRAERDGVVYECGRSNALMDKFYPLMLLTRRRHRMPPPPVAWFRNLMEFSGGALTIHVASYKGAPVASILTLNFRKTAFYKYAGSDPAHHKLGSIPFLVWRAIRQAKADRIQSFDLGRSENHQNGLVDFKDRWAGERTLVTYWRSPARTKQFWLGDGPALRMAGRFFEFLPSSMLQVMGQLLYRHIG
jgi:hypothetical protein